MSRYCLSSDIPVPHAGDVVFDHPWEKGKAMSPATIPLLMVLIATSVSPAAFATEDGKRPSTIDVFVTSNAEISGQRADVKVYVVDGLAALDRELSEGLPRDPKAAQKEALKRINALGDGFRARAESAAEGLVLAQEYGIKRVPAIVFDDGISVVYGVTDIGDAIEIYRQRVRP